MDEIITVLSTADTLRDDIATYENQGYKILDMIPRGEIQGDLTLTFQLVPVPTPAVEDPVNG